MEFDDSDIIENMAYLQLKITNKSKYKVEFLLEDVYINDISVLAMRPGFIYVDSGKIYTSPFTILKGNTGLEIGDIKTIEFKIEAINEDYDTIHATKKITIKL